MKQLVMLILCPFLLCSCRTGRLDEFPTSGTRTYKTDFKFYGASRTYRLHAPPTIEKEERPLVIVLHGAFSTAKEIEEQSEFSRLADKYGFYVAYPNGIGIFGKLQHWNAGHCCGKAAKDEIDDVTFIDDILTDITSTLSIHTDQIYLVGYSNGGMMAYRYAQERAERLTAVAVVSGALNSTCADSPEWAPSRPSKPTPFLIMHGTADEAIPLDGGESPAKKNGRKWSSVKDAGAFWNEANRDQAPVETIVIEGGGHAWPTEHDAAETIWSFFQSLEL